MAIVDFDTWKDFDGTIRRVPGKSHSRIKASKYASHKALQTYIFIRDNYTCQKCGAKNNKKIYPFTVFSKKWKKKTFLTIDHIKSIRKGGTHHPSNLQALCDLCNCQKGGG